MAALNCALSATTAKPHTRSRPTGEQDRIVEEEPPATSAQPPEITRLPSRNRRAPDAIGQGIGDHASQRSRRWPRREADQARRPCAPAGALIAGEQEIGTQAHIA